jgi:SAM-dependent methyltransferase
MQELVRFLGPGGVCDGEANCDDMAESLGSAGNEDASRSPDSPSRVGETLLELPGLSDALQSGGGTYLEVGAGFGARLRTLVDRGAMRNYDRLIVTDLSAERVRFARSLLPEAETVVCDAEALPFADESIDFALSDQVIEHVPSDEAMAREIVRVLRRGGQAYVGSVIKGPRAWYFYRNGGEWRLDPTHVREYGSLAAYRSVFESVGLAVVDAWTEQISFPVGETMLRPFVHAGALAGGSAYELHGRSRMLRGLSRLRVPIPGYHGCWVHLRK